MTIQLNNGKTMPIIGLGTWDAPKGEVGKAVETALSVGYRLIDCARYYKNEEEIGSMGIKPFLQTHQRNELFITSKLWPDQVLRVKESCQETINNLQCEYLDLYLIHWPVALKLNVGLPNGPEDFIDQDLTETWKEMEKLVDEGLVKSIGISNCNEQQIEKIMKMCRIKPVVNQVECNVYLQQEKLREVCKKYDIVLEGYRPIGGKVSGENINCLSDEIVVELAKKYEKSPAQICIRWLVQNGIIAIPKSVNAERLKSNLDVLNWKLSEEDMELLKSRNKNQRGCLMNAFWNGKTREEFWGESF